VVTKRMAILFHDQAVESCEFIPFAQLAVLELPAFSRSMTDARFRAAIAGLGQFTIRTDAGLAVKAPEETIIASWHGRIQLSQNELTFPAQCRAEIGMMNVEAL